MGSGHFVSSSSWAYPYRWNCYRKLARYRGHLCLANTYTNAYPNANADADTGMAGATNTSSTFAKFHTRRSHLSASERFYNPNSNFD